MQRIRSRAYARREGESHMGRVTCCFQYMVSGNLNLKYGVMMPGCKYWPSCEPRWPSSEPSLKLESLALVLQIGAA